MQYIFLYIHPTIHCILCRTIHWCIHSVVNLYQKGKQCDLFIKLSSHLSHFTEYPFIHSLHSLIYSPIHSLYPLPDYSLMHSFSHSSMPEMVSMVEHSSNLSFIHHILLNIHSLFITFSYIFTHSSFSGLFSDAFI